MLRYLEIYLFVSLECELFTMADNVDYPGNV